MSKEKCYFCGGAVKKKMVRVDYRWGDNLTILENVPAFVCEQCGERYFDAKIAKQMEKLALSKEKAKKLIKVPVKEFKKVKVS